MRLSQHTDYALRLLMYLAVHEQRPATVPEVAAVYGISSNHLAKVAQQLVHHGWVQSIRGRGGGLRLACDPESVGLGDVIRQTERSITLVECMGEDSTCPIEPACDLKGVLGEALEAFLAVVDRYTLADLLQQRDALVPLMVDGRSAAEP